jgi:hypothetical protein
MADPTAKTSQPQSPSKPPTVEEKLAVARRWQEKIEKGLKLPNLTADEHALLLTQKRAAAAAVHAYERALAHERANKPPSPDDLAMCRLLNMPTPPVHW